MTKYLLNPKIIAHDSKMLTGPQLNRLLRRIQSKKFGAKMVAVDVEEVTTTKDTHLRGRYHNNDYIILPPGNYFNVHIEYAL